MKKAFCVFAGLVSVFFAGCAKTDNNTAMQNVNYKDLQKLKIENAVADAEESVKSNDFRLLAVKGYTIEVPGVSEDIQNIKTNYGIKIIEGTSDAIEGSEHGKLIDNARAYAEKYNQTIVVEKKKNAAP